MARDLSSGMQTQVTAPVLRPVIFAEIHNDGDTLYLWTGDRDISWNGQTWTGMGLIIGALVIPESSQIRADGVNLVLSGIPSDLLSAALTELRQGKPVKIYFGAMNVDGTVVADPYASFIGRADQVTIQDSGSTGTIQLSVENRLIDLQRPRQRRYEPEDQKAEYPDDLGFDFVPELQAINLSYGTPGSVVPQSSAGGGTVGDSGNDRMVTTNP